jgi:hypothetical protein
MSPSDGTAAGLLSDVARCSQRNTSVPSALVSVRVCVRNGRAR